jgi:putative oxidoreductase
MFKKLMGTDENLSGTILRILLGAVMLPHGAQLVLGMFGGGGLKASLNMFQTAFHIPIYLAIAAILAPSLGALALIAGFFTRLAALGIAIFMGMAVYLVHWKIGFFMNWMGNQKGEGFEYHILAIAIALALMIRGGGRWSVDRAIAGK